MTIVSGIIKTSNHIKTERDHRDVLAVLVEEVGELATEISIASGKKQREPGEDGVVGEAVDVIINAVDIINRELKNQGYTSPAAIKMIIENRVEMKLVKWEAKES